MAEPQPPIAPEQAASSPPPAPEQAAASSPPAPERAGAGPAAVAAVAPELDQARRTSMAAERTWLAWWRSALAASAGALAVGRLAPELLDVAPWPYVLLGCGYASLAIGLLIVGALRQRELERALRTGHHVPLPVRTVGVFTVGGVSLAVITVVLVIAQT
jgi:putative membrane protein